LPVLLINQAVAQAVAAISETRKARYSTRKFSPYNNELRRGTAGKILPARSPARRHIPVPLQPVSWIRDGLLAILA